MVKENNIKNDWYDTNNYITLSRFISYYHQISEIDNLNVNSILEIGIGNKIVYDYFKFKNKNIVSCDINEELYPDVVGDIRSLPIENNRFDLVCAFQILEHIPLKDLDVALNELFRVTKEYCIISLPYDNFSLDINLRIPFVGRKFDNNIINLRFGISNFWKENKFDNCHYWELGRKNTSIEIIRCNLEEYFDVIKEFSPKLNHYHYFFVLKKK